MAVEHAGLVGLRKTLGMSRYLTATLAVIALAATAASGVSASGPAVTKVAYVAPVDANGDPVEGLTITRTVHGHCFPGSDSVPGPTYRCFFGNYIEDPCWADVTDPGSVLCMTQPWSKTAVRLYASNLEYSAEPVPPSPTIPGEWNSATGKNALRSKAPTTSTEDGSSTTAAVSTTSGACCCAKCTSRGRCGASTARSGTAKSTCPADACRFVWRGTAVLSPARPASEQRAGRCRCRPWPDRGAGAGTEQHHSGVGGPEFPVSAAGGELVEAKTPPTTARNMGTSARPRALTATSRTSLPDVSTSL